MSELEILDRVDQVARLLKKQAVLKKGEATRLEHLSTQMQEMRVATKEAFNRLLKTKPPKKAEKR